MGTANDIVYRRCCLQDPVEVAQFFFHLLYKTNFLKNQGLQRFNYYFVAECFSKQGTEVNMFLELKK